jgi:diguanylate cyclase (GGDEF)-like protein
VVQGVLRDHERILEKKGIECQIQMDPNCPVIWADFDRLHQVLSSLLRNLGNRTDADGLISLKAASVEGKREGDPTSLIHVTLTSRSPSAGDSGSASGAAPSRSSPKTAKTIPLGREKSLGIGIVLCKQILDQCGGNLWMDNGESALGHTIHFVLPTRGAIGKIEPDEILTRERLAGPIPSEIQKGKKGILVVDDDPSLVNALVFALTKEGYNVHSTTSARRALEMVQKAKPDLIISDITMPEMDGYAFLQELQKDETSKMIPFIFISAKGEPGDRIRGLKTGVDDYLSKPFEIKELAARVEALLVRVERLKDLSRFDGLTGAMTRRAFEEILPQELRKAQINGQPLSLAMADLDHFKHVNDSHGHLIGDFVLRSFVRLLKKNLRDDAVLVRYGGEEFCIVMPDVQKHVAQEILERVRKILDETSFFYEKENLHVRVTCSFGVSGFPEDSGNPEGLIEKSDGALYEAKSQGRNRVWVHGQKQASPSSGNSEKRRDAPEQP